MTEAMNEPTVAPAPMEHGQASTKSAAPAATAEQAALLTPTEVNDSLTGWDELAIKNAAGLTLGQLSKDEVHLLRCLGAVVIARRDKVKIELAYRSVMEMKQGDVTDLFADEPDDVLPDDPDSAVGKGESPTATTPTTSPGSSSSPASDLPSTAGSPV